MGLRGPQPKPSALKIAQGNPGRRAISENEPIPPPGTVVPPPWVDGQALEIWTYIAPVLVAMKTLTTADVLPFARYCIAYARYLELREALWKKGWSGTTYPIRTDGKTRGVAELPQAGELRRLHEILSRLEDRFGLTPSARTRLRVEHTGPASTPSGPIPPTFRIFAKYGPPGATPPPAPPPAPPPTRKPKPIPPSPDIPF
jgi:P27 family predicted phage terminase small subunit